MLVPEPVVYKRTAASPKPRPAASITPVIILGRQAGSNMWNIACQRVEPSPIPASKYPLGSPFMASSVVVVISGSVMIDTDNAPAIRLLSSPIITRKMR